MNVSEGLREVLGRRVRVLREESGRRQVDVATAARAFGLAWPASKVAALEAGGKSVSGEELLLLPAVLTAALGRPVSYGDLFDDSATVRLSPAVLAPAREIPELLAGHCVAQLRDPQREAEIERQAPAVRRAIAEHQRRAKALGLDRVEPRRVLAVEKTETETEARVASRLGEPRRILSRAYALLWGCSLSARRDALVAEQLPAGAPARTVQAKRGRITRNLVAEVEDFIRTAERKSHGKRRAQD